MTLASWTGLKDITDTTKAADAITIATGGPGIGIQLEHGQHEAASSMPLASLLGDVLGRAIQRRSWSYLAAWRVYQALAA